LEIKGLNNIQMNPSGPLGQVGSKPVQGGNFEQTLREQVLRSGNVGKSEVLPDLKFSGHAVERMRSRGIRFNAEEMASINSAVKKASEKGAQNTLVLTDASAMIVNIKSNTVVTVMDKMQLKENVFTNIDSTVVV
jgi:flagellar operon protein